MKKLSHIYDERVKEINERIASINNSQLVNSNSVYIPSLNDIDVIANEKMIYFISDAPVFNYMFINEKNVVESKIFTCNTYKFDDDFIKMANNEYYNNSNVFAFYSLSNNGYMTLIRGAFVTIRKEDMWWYLIENRDKKIDDIIS